MTATVLNANGTDSYSFTGASSSDTLTFTLLGGLYGAVCVATFGGGSVDLQVLAPGGTYVSVFSSLILANGTKLLELAPGSYKVVIVTATAVAFALSRIPRRNS